MNRLVKLRKSIADLGLDCLLIGSASNRRYLSGFTGSAGWLLVSSQKSYLAVDFRYVEQAKKEVIGFEILHIKNNISQWLAALVSDLGITKLGIESDHLTLTEYQSLTEAIKSGHDAVQIIPVSKLVESIRITKDAGELICIQDACRVADQAMAYAGESLRTGMTEKQLAWELESFMRQHGSDALPFEIIVASGPNSALPHARPTDRVISENEPVLIDLGARIAGYCSDMTRTYIIGNTDGDFNKIYNVVLGAQLTALSIIEAGMIAGKVDNMVREIIGRAGYGEHFGHGLGHGIGLDAHELPGIRADSEEILRNNVVFTVEPGVYVPGWGGIRIEDTVTIEKGKLKSITKTGKMAQIHGG